MSGCSPPTTASSPDLRAVDWSRDVVFTWNGTTSGVRVPDADWIADDREGLAICDATSAVFAMDVPIAKLDVVTYSWQKVLGGEAQHGVLILSPRAVERLETLPARLAAAQDLPHDQGRQVHGGHLPGRHHQHPVHALRGGRPRRAAWAEAIGGLPELIRRSEANLAAVAAWVERTAWVDFLAEDPRTRSCTSICLKIVDPGSPAWKPRRRPVRPRESPRCWRPKAWPTTSPPTAKPLRDCACGAARRWRTADLEALFPWLDWAYAAVKAGQ